MTHLSAKRRSPPDFLRVGDWMYLNDRIYTITDIKGLEIIATDDQGITGIFSIQQLLLPLDDGSNGALFAPSKKLLLDRLVQQGKPKKHYHPNELPENFRITAKAVVNLYHYVTSSIENLKHQANLGKLKFRRI